MDRRERMGSSYAALRAAQDGLQARIWTAMPGTLQSFDPSAITATVQPNIQAQVQQPDGTWLDVNLPLCVDCPVKFPSGGGFIFSHPLTQGDEGLLVWSMRCIDAWWQQGGTQKQAEVRMHDPSDGFFLPGVFSQASRAPATGGISTNEAQMRSLDGVVLCRINRTTRQAALVAGVTSILVDDVTDKVSVSALGGLWVNGVPVTVP